jgi:DNA-binding transcriptional MerR regulator
MGRHDKRSSVDDCAKTSGGAGSRSADAQDGTGSGATPSTRRKAKPESEEEARCALDRSTKLYYRIGEVSELTGVKAHVLRYWETEFRWMAPPKSRSKQRLYRKRDVEFVWLLKKLLWNQRYTIAGARQRIQELGLDESLARAAAGRSIDDSLQGVDEAAPEIRVESSAVEAVASEPVVRRPGAQDWLGIRAALDSMQSELLALRGVLQQGT